MLNRRSLLQRSLQLCAALAVQRRSHALMNDVGTLRIRLTEDSPISLPADFTGLGYEMSSVARLGLLSPDNSRYVELVRGLGPQGVLRVGGIVANYTRYAAAGAAAGEKQDTVINRDRLEQFGAFFEAVGWTAIWSVNFAQGSIDDAVTEAHAVREVLGSRLLALELGNEVDSYGHGQPFRASTYNYDAYRREYTEWREAIKKAVPAIAFAAPDTAASYDWVERMAADANGEVQLLTTHYYRNGQKNGSAEQLLNPDPRLLTALAGLRKASRESGIPWRMCETNSFSGGGRPGVSDTIVGALWTLDFMLLLAQHGCSGVNIETGVNQLGFVSSYSPIQDDGKGMNSAGVPYYGMLAFANAVRECDQVLPILLDDLGVNVTAYVLGKGKRSRCVVVVNKDRFRDVRLHIDVGLGASVGMRLLSPSLDSTSGITFAGTAVDDHGRWTAGKLETIAPSALAVPRMSAIVIRAVT